MEAQEGTGWPHGMPQTDLHFAGDGDVAGCAEKVPGTAWPPDSRRCSRGRRRRGRRHSRRERSCVAARCVIRWRAPLGPPSDWPATMGSSCKHRVDPHSLVSQLPGTLAEPNESSLAGAVGRRQVSEHSGGGHLQGLRRVCRPFSSAPRQNMSSSHPADAPPWWVSGRAVASALRCGDRRRLGGGR